jgi:thiamine biosynthesis lipoprotein
MKRTLCFTLLLVSFGSGAGCASAVRQKATDEEATATAALVRREYARSCMGGAARITLYAPSEDAALDAARRAFAFLDALEAALSDYRADSELSRINRAAGGAPVVVGEHTMAALAAARELAARTDGLFDPTIGPVVRLWREARRTGVLPAPDARRAAVALVSWRDLELDAEDRSVRLARPGMALDLGGFGKGYAAHETVKLLAGLGLRRVLVGLEGDYAAGDPPPDAEGWRIGLADGGEPLSLRNACVSTSGADARFVEIDGRVYSHVVDPRTGVGVAPGPRVTVVAPDGGTADALSTALSAAGTEAAGAIGARFHGVRIRVDETR